MAIDIDTLAENVRIHCRLKEFDLARRICRDSLDLALNNVDRATILRKLAYIENAAEDAAACIAYLQKAYDFDPRSRGVLDALMRAQISSGNYAEASEACLLLIELDKQFQIQPFTSSGYFHLAYCNLHLDRLEEAEFALGKCKFDDPVWIDGQLLTASDLTNLIGWRRGRPL